jgi:hypothetical protein
LTNIASCCQADESIKICYHHVVTLETMKQMYKERLLLATFLRVCFLGLLFNPEDGGSTYLRNVSKLLDFPEDTTVTYLTKARIGKSEKPPLLGNGCVPCNNTRAIAKQRTHVTIK